MENLNNIISTQKTISPTSSLTLSCDTNDIHENEPVINFKESIVKSIVQPNYLSEIKGKINAKNCWRRINVLMMIFGKILTGVSAVLSFVSVYKIDTLYSFISGGTATIATIIMGFEIGASKEITKKETEINNILKSLNIDNFPKDDSNNV